MRNIKYIPVPKWNFSLWTAYKQLLASRSYQKVGFVLHSQRMDTMWWSGRIWGIVSIYVSKFPIFISTQIWNNKDYVKEVIKHYINTHFFEESYTAKMLPKNSFNLKLYTTLPLSKLANIMISNQYSITKWKPSLKWKYC